MKEYFGYPSESDDTPARVGYRSPGKSPVSLVLHTNSAKHPTFDWGVVCIPSKNLARSILLDAFGTEKCGNSPNKCRCSNKWVPDNVVDKFEQEIVVAKLINKEIFKINQLEVCDFAFEVLENINKEPEVNLDIELDSLELKEPELI